jgi:hypothetical protein
VWQFCNKEGCRWQGKKSSALKQHLANTHGEGIVWHACNRAGCLYKTKKASILLQHKQNKHNENVTWYECPQEGCNYRAKQVETLRQHKIHKHVNGDVWFPCGRENCTYKTRYAGTLKQHMLVVHSDHTPAHCDFEDCDYKGKTKTALRKHKERRHGAPQSMVLPPEHQYDKYAKYDAQPASHQGYLPVDPGHYGIPQQMVANNGYHHHQQPQHIIQQRMSGYDASLQSLQPGLQPAMQQGLAPAMQQALQPAMQQALQPAMHQAFQPAMQQALQPAMQQALGGGVINSDSDNLMSMNIAIARNAAAANAAFQPPHPPMQNYPQGYGTLASAAHLLSSGAGMGQSNQPPLTVPQLTNNGLAVPPTYGGDKKAEMVV